LSSLDRLSNDPAVPASVRHALERAAAERASPELLNRVLAATGLGAGAAAAMGVGAAGKISPFASTLFGASFAAKCGVAVAIFVAGGLVGGLVVHRHDARQAALDLATPLRTPRAPLRSPLHETVETENALGPSPLGPSPLGPSTGASAPPTSTPAPDSLPPRRASRPARHGADSPKERQAPSPSSPARPSAPSSRDQLGSLRTIVDAIESHRPADALATIEAHRSQFPATEFDQELLFFEAQARAARGEPAACGLLDRLETIYPHSLLLPRVNDLRAEAHCRLASRSAAPSRGDLER
jgi:hypothetical protein